MNTPKCKVGQSVVCYRKKKWVKGTIAEKMEAPRSYIVRPFDGGLVRRNTWHHRKSSSEPDRIDRPRVVPYELTPELSVLQNTRVMNQGCLEQEVQQLPNHLDRRKYEEQAAPRTYTRWPRKHRNQQERGQAELARPAAGYSRRGRPNQLPSRFNDLFLVQVECTESVQSWWLVIMKNKSNIKTETCAYLWSSHVD